MATIKQIGEIQIFAEIYQGATTLVYKGYQPSLDRVVLLKLLRPELNRDGQLCQRFEDEAKLIAKIQHPNVVAIYDYGHKDQVTYIAAEFIEGLNLHDLIQIGPIPADIAWLILLETARGLKAAHDKNIIHKDIKPSNILISHEGQVKLTDFGMASLHLPAADQEVEEVKGTLAYMSPEQILGEETNKSSDIFALGATFYEMLTGSQAFFGQTPGEYMNAILHDEPTQFLKKYVAMPPELRQICQKMLRKNPAHRYQDCQDLIQDLEALQTKYKFTLNSNNLKTYLEKPKAYASDAFSSKALKAPIAKHTRMRYYILFASFLALMLILGYYGLFLNKSKKTPGQEVSNKSGISSNEKLASSLNDSSDLQLTVEQWLSFDKNPESSISESKSDVAVQEEHSANQDRPEPEAESVVLDESPQAYSPGRLGYLTISCTPWAAVYIDGDSIGATPFENSMELTAGRHEIIMKNPEFPRYREWIEIRNGEKTTIELSLWSLAGTLKLTVSPWAEIYVDGEYKDTVPPQDRPIILSPGRHSLILKHPVLGEWQTPIEISAGQSLELKFNLKNLISR